ncbi:MAG: DUF2085 domain-containing protein [Chloroflexi bacterium]|nr:DUF2085 domain-containing protein [Chloroflexota bacterium]
MVQKASDEYYWIEGISPWRKALDRSFSAAAAEAARWVVRHWLLLANASNAATVVGAILSPYLMAQGLVGVARAIFAAYSLICAQNPGHSYFLLGYQMAMDQRMIAIYTAATAAGLAYTAFRSSLRSLHWKWYLMLISPMAVDGFTQLFGWRQSNWELRSITGALFGAASVWWLYPFLEHQVSRLRTGMERKTAHLLAP